MYISGEKTVKEEVAVHMCSFDGFREVTTLEKSQLEDLKLK